MPNMKAPAHMVWEKEIFKVFSFGCHVLGRVENIVGQGENAGYQHFLLFSQCF